jgi:hypothetical protein
VLLLCIGRRASSASGRRRAISASIAAAAVCCCRKLRARLITRGRNAGNDSIHPELAVGLLRLELEPRASCVPRRQKSPALCAAASRSSDRRAAQRGRSVSVARRFAEYSGGSGRPSRNIIGRLVSGSGRVPGLELRAAAGLALIKVSPSKLAICSRQKASTRQFSKEPRPCWSSCHHDPVREWLETIGPRR